MMTPHKPRRRIRRLLPYCAVAALLVPGTAAAQLVTPKTVPVHQGEQFDIYPSSRPGMAGVSIALDDTLSDPFVNPAKAARIRSGSVFSAPFSHSVSGDRGGGRTLPVGGVAPMGAWSLAAVAALQEIDRAGPIWNRPNSERTATNRYLSASLARQLGGGLSAGLGVFGASLGAIDGVDLLYGGSDRIEQEGSLSDVRLGVVKEWADQRTLEVLLLHNRTHMVHDVRFPAIRRWDPVRRTLVDSVAAREEHNVDRTHIWGAHAEYTRPVGTEGWRLGWLATANRLSHPKIPNYVFMNIPRDPGTTYAFNAGVGAGRTAGPVSVGIDVVYEPMWSETWADAERDTTGAGGRVIRAGGRTVENTFRFDNAKLRMGVGRDFYLGSDSATTLGLQFGLSVYAIDYRLKQINHVLDSSRRQRESWTEWSPTFAFRMRGKGLEVAYAARLTCGARGCEENNPILFVDRGFLDAAAPGGIIAAPSGPLSFDGGSVWAHRFTVSVPLH